MAAKYFEKALTAGDSVWLLKTNLRPMFFREKIPEGTEEESHYYANLLIEDKLTKVGKKYVYTAYNRFDFEGNEAPEGGVTGDYRLFPTKEAGIEYLKKKRKICELRQMIDRLYIRQTFEECPLSAIETAWNSLHEYL